LNFAGMKWSEWDDSNLHKSESQDPFAANSCCQLI
jgi:hypothetical protein